MFYLLFLLILAPLSAGEFYISDGLGIQGEAIDGIHSAPWVLELSGDDVRTLYKAGGLYKRWVGNHYEENGRILRREEYYFRESLKTVSVTDSNGMLISEILYDTQGSFMVENIFSYQGDRLSSIEQRDHEGKTLNIRHFSYRNDGSLRSLIAEGEGHIDWRAASFSEQALDCLYLEDGQRTSSFHYKNGKIYSQKESLDNNPLQKTEFFYGTEGSPEKEILYDYTDNSKRIRYFNKDGNLTIQNLYIDDILERVEINSYDEELLLVKEERSADSRMRWEYEYRDGETDPYITREYINGSLVKETETVSEGTMETLYRRGEPILSRIKDAEK